MALAVPEEDVCKFRGGEVPYGGTGERGEVVHMQPLCIYVTESVCRVLKEGGD